MIEVEIKVRITEPEKIRQKFEQLEGKYMLSLEHEDTYYNMPERLRDFRKTDEALRIRKSTEFQKEDKQKGEITNFYLTYKGKKLDKVSKTREELETKVKDGKKLKQILDLLTFREIFTVKKERELYKIPFDGKQIEALIDYLPILQEHFIEVEIRAKDEGQIKSAREILFRFLKKIGITKEESIRKSYLELIAEEFKKKSKRNRNKNKK
ncbi:MAG: class IV adenylate cyclase [Promethearchaeia archaeon]